MRYTLMHEGKEYLPINLELEYNFVVGVDKKKKNWPIPKATLTMSGNNILINVENRHPEYYYAITYTSGKSTHWSRLMDQHGVHGALIWIELDNQGQAQINKSDIPEPRNLYTLNMWLRNLGYDEWTEYRFTISLLAYRKVSEEQQHSYMPVITTSNLLLITQQI